MKKEMYHFDPDDAYRFAEEMHIKAYTRGDELHLQTCPYCHGSAGRDKKTFAINLKTGQFNCLRSSCGAHGNMIVLAKDFGFSLGDEVDEWMNQKKKFKHLPQGKPTTKPAAVEFLESRKISKETAEKYNIGLKKGDHTVLVIPFYDENDVLTFVKYRKIGFDKSKGGSKEWAEADCKPILFGMNHCDPETNKTLVLTEGQLDSLSLAEAGIENAVSVPNGAKGFTWTPYCWDFLVKFDELIVFGDYENDHISLLDEMRTRFQGRIMHVRPEDYRGCKDANDILREYGPEALREAVDNAVPPKNPRIIRMVDVESVDLLQKEQFLSGFHWLDQLLGGFYFGQLIIITGERGEGKSTLASQFGVMAVNAGYKVFLYSGEMNPDRVKDWFEAQTAGARNINKIEREDRGTFFKVHEDVREKIEEWYGDKVLMYNNRMLEELDDENDAVTKTMENAIQQYSCRVIIIDNLMTALEDDMSADIYRQQTAFVRALAKMSRRYDVLTFLVAHPRKGSSSGFRNDDVSGSANITNLADVVIRYGRPKDEPNATSRILSVHKNRMTGRIDQDGTRLYFQESSKRISPIDGAFDLDLEWEKTEDGFIESDEPIFD
ncbi:MAG: AAA family ATPase [Clostridia bacterium]|nr:AAA family ATPase [Clostridia bacterium]